MLIYDVIYAEKNLNDVSVRNHFLVLQKELKFVNKYTVITVMLISVCISSAVTLSQSISHSVIMRWDLVHFQNDVDDWKTSLMTAQTWFWYDCLVMMTIAHNYSSTDHFISLSSVWCLRRLQFSLNSLDTNSFILQSS